MAAPPAQQQEGTNTPPISRSSSSSSQTSKKRRSPNLSLDFSDLPPLSQPTPPSNTLLVTNLDNPAIFEKDSLARIEARIASYIAPEQIHSFGPLRTLRRIIITFYDSNAALVVRSRLDGKAVSFLLPPSHQSSAAASEWHSFGNSNRIRVSFGAPTPIHAPEDVHLQAPKADKQFFISPPPSPPMGWEMKEEDPPNKDVHPIDLGIALDQLASRRSSGAGSEGEGVSPVDATLERVKTGDAGRAGGRQRSGSVIVFHPEDHGSSPDLPAIAVEDTTMTMADSPGDLSPVDETWPRAGKKILAHTARPPVELMQE